MANKRQLTYDVIERSNGTRFLQSREMSISEFKSLKLKEKKRKKSMQTEIINNLSPHGARCIICGKFRIDDVRKCKKEFGIFSSPEVTKVVCIHCCNSIVDKSVIAAQLGPKRRNYKYNLYGVFPEKIISYRGETIQFSQLYFRMRICPALKRRLKKKNYYVYTSWYGYK